MRNMSKKTRKLIDRKVVHKYFWFDYLEGSIFYHSNHVWPARLWIGDAIDHNDDTQCWMYVPAHKEYVAGATGGGIGTIVGVAVAIWGIYKLGMYHGADCEVEYLGYLFNKQLGDEQYEQCRKAINRQINEDYEKAKQK